MVSNLNSAQAIVPIGKMNWEKVDLETGDSLEYAARYNDVMRQVNVLHLIVRHLENVYVRY